jgi:hypothetical protein
MARYIENRFKNEWESWEKKLPWWCRILFSTAPIEAVFRDGWFAGAEFEAEMIGQAQVEIANRETIWCVTHSDGAPTACYGDRREDAIEAFDEIYADGFDEMSRRDGYEVRRFALMPLPSMVKGCR